MTKKFQQEKKKKKTLKCIVITILEWINMKKKSINLINKSDEVDEVNTSSLQVNFSTSTTTYSREKIST